MDVARQKSELASFETYIPTGNSLVERVFLTVLFGTLAFFFATGWHFRNVKALPEVMNERQTAVNAQFIIEEKKPKPKVEKPKPPAEKKEAAIKEEPVDLTAKPLLNQEKDEVVEAPPQEQVKQPVRRVYGLKKVYSTGIGASGSVADAIIGKRGNTLNTEIDTITATEADIKGVPVSITTVTTYPRPKSQVKPEYTKEMLEKRVEGVVRVKVLVDIDGKVKQAIVLDDLGYGSKQKVAEACFKMEFEPARRGEEPVSVWIMIKFRFEMLEG